MDHKREVSSVAAVGIPSFRKGGAEESIQVVDLILFYFYFVVFQKD